MEPKIKHAGDCTIYSAIINDRPEDGICTCGYGLELTRNGDRSQMYSQELQTLLKIFPPRRTPVKAGESSPGANEGRCSSRRLE